MLRKLSAPNIQRIKGICAIAAMLQRVVLRLGIFLGGLVLLEAVASAFHTISKLQELGHRCFSSALFAPLPFPEFPIGNPKPPLPNRRRGNTESQLVSERGRRRNRFTSQTRLHLGPDSVVSPP